MSPSPANFRHSLAHVLAQAVEILYPAAKRTIGPEIDNGFYFDFDFGDVKVGEEDLSRIEVKMREILIENQRFERYEMPIADAIAKARDVEHNPYKVEILEDLQRGGETIVSYYRNVRGDGTCAYEDLCRGPHVEATGVIDVGGFRLDRIAGAYWRGDEKNRMLTRIYGLAFENRKALDEYVYLIEEAKKRDHRVLGKKLKIFTVSDLIGAGLPLLQPNGMIIRQEIESYLWELHKGKGYHRVWTPHIAKESLYITSGHAAKFGDELFRVSGKEEKFFMKPMNCPHHMQIFADNQWSYRDMPVRYFEPATIYRDEKTGQLSGLTRVRAITQDDGHLFCRVSQIGQEVDTIVGIIHQFYTTFGLISDYWVRLSIRGEDRSAYIGSDEVWNTAESMLEAAAKKNNLPYRPGPGEAAFYGPKLDFMFHDALGREWQLATVQCDFNLPERFDLSFVNEQGERERPVVIHRAISGSLERFMGIMIEHFAGIFPTWLAPTQVAIIPVSEAFSDYARGITERLQSEDIRVRLESSDETLGKRIKKSEGEHIPYMIVVGQKEVESGMINVRVYKTKEQLSVSVDEFVRDISAEVRERRL